MKIDKIWILSLMICWNFSFACKCFEIEKEVMVEKGLKNADIVFYGELIKSDSIQETYTFRIIELFKGNFKSAIISGKTTSDCSIFPFEKGFWIVYSKLSKDKIIDISMCSPSQSMDFGFGYPPPPPKININGKLVNPSETEIRLFELEYKNKSLSNFIYQLEKLRQYKTSHISLAEESKNRFQNKITIISLTTNMLLLLTILLIIVSKKKSNNRITP
ncbi:hypothetical protein [Flavobacterium phycosphaerae]|uniref:hypothetical protein n=1 Tax=Flavobacterium phycosphaerae TaxID=2697515 RepID=UPI00138B0625|nr:hypothetical protein [Flavobacterium phycosphaerae]